MLRPRQAVAICAERPAAKLSVKTRVTTRRLTSADSCDRNTLLVQREMTVAESERERHKGSSFARRSSRKSTGIMLKLIEPGPNTSE